MKSILIMGRILPKNKMCVVCQETKSKGKYYHNNFICESCEKEIGLNVFDGVSKKLLEGVKTL